MNAPVSPEEMAELLVRRDKLRKLVAELHKMTSLNRSRGLSRAQCAPAAKRLTEMNARLKQLNQQIRVHATREIVAGRTSDDPAYRKQCAGAAFKVAKAAHFALREDGCPAEILEALAELDKLNPHWFTDDKVRERTAPQPRTAIDPTKVAQIQEWVEQRNASFTPYDVVVGTGCDRPVVVAVLARLLRARTISRLDRGIYKRGDFKPVVEDED